MRVDVEAEVDVELRERTDDEEGSLGGRTKLLKKSSVSTLVVSSDVSSKVCPRGRRSESLCLEEDVDER